MILHITTHKDWEKAQMEGEYSAPSRRERTTQLNPVAVSTH
jgi:uncharacterized protein (DUF952 family)